VEGLQLVELALRPAEQVGLDRDVGRRAAMTDQANPVTDN
jgi:hypothetical protein